MHAESNDKQGATGGIASASAISQVRVTAIQSMMSQKSPRCAHAVCRKPISRDLTNKTRQNKHITRNQLQQRILDLTKDVAYLGRNAYAITLEIIGENQLNHQVRGGCCGVQVWWR
jgi:hypothetical protein